MIHLEEFTGAKFRLVRDYLIILVCALGVFGITNVIIAANFFSCIFFCVLICFFVLLIFTKLYRNKGMQYVALLICALVVCFFALDKKQAHATLFYINILLSVIFIFGWRQDHYKIISLFALVILLAYVNLFTDLFVVEPFLNLSQYSMLLVLTVVFFFVFFLLNVWYINKMNRLMRSYVDYISFNTIVPTDDALRDEVSMEDLNRLKAELYEDHKGFLNHFQLLFPAFYGKLLGKPGLKISDRELLALLKLNYSTNEIAQITNQSSKSVESKKYRLRKKMHLPKGENLNTWVQEL